MSSRALNVSSCDFLISYRCLPVVLYCTGRASCSDGHGIQFSRFRVQYSRHLVFSLSCVAVTQFPFAEIPLVIRYPVKSLAAFTRSTRPEGMYPEMSFLE